jgi:hypothetical protein
MTENTPDEAKLARARSRISAGATLEQAAAECGIEPATLKKLLEATAKRKTWSRFEVTFWLPD